MMPDYGALGGALLISDQLSTYRVLDRLKRARDNNDLVIDNTILRRAVDEVVAQYNQLVHAFNELSQRAGAVAEDNASKRAAVDRLEAANSNLRAERDQLKFRLLDVSTELAVLRQLDRERNPDAYPPQ
jgi:small-conductance mechanosensitive channel